MPEIALDVVLTGDRRMAAGYAMFFAITAAMPGWRSLAGVGFVLGMLIVSGLGYLSQLDAPGGAGVAHAIALGIVAFSGFGLLAGALTRALSLFLRELAISRGIRIAVTVFGFLLFPVLTVVSLSASEWSYRMPSEACLQSNIRVRLAGEIYELPAAPMFTLQMSDENRVYDFAANAHQRAVCALARDAVEPLRVTALRMRFDGLANESNSRVVAFCRTPSSLWAMEHCRSAADSETPPDDLEGYPKKAVLYSPDEFVRYHGYRYRPGSGAGSHAQFIQALTEARARGKRLDSARAGIFERYSNGYWVAHSGLWTTDGGDPITFRCHETGKPETLHCMTAYELADGTGVAFWFDATASDLEAAARTANHNLLAAMSELSAAD